MDWSVDFERGHCAHKEGLSAFLDVGHEEASFIRCLGPFGSEVMGQKDVLKLMKSLTRLIESRFDAQEKFLVWGGYADQPDYFEHRFPIQGSICGFLPNLALRELVLDGEESARGVWSWRSQQSLLFHISGLQVNKLQRSIDLSKVDPQLLHPSFLEVQTRQLAALGLTPGPYDGLPDLTIELGPLNWTKFGQSVRIVG